MNEGGTLVAFLAVIAATSLLAVAARRFHPTGRLPSLEGWALADRGLGTGWSWLLIGGTFFTAYTFTAVPGLAYGNGAPAFFAIPYTIIACPLAFVLLPRLWSVCARNGYITAADFVRGRYGSPPLALVVALTGILATMPYLALQVLGIRAILAAGGIDADALGADLAMIALFAGLAVATYRYGLRAPTVIAAFKGVAVFGSVVVAVWLVLDDLGGPGAVFERAARHMTEGGAGDAALLLTPHQQTAYATLALGSAFAVLMYPHMLTAAFAAKSPDTLRRVTIGLPAWIAVLALFGLLGIAAVAERIRVTAGGAEVAVPLLVDQLMPPAVAGLVFGAITVGALVPAAVMSVAAATSFVRNVYVEYVHPTATPKRQVRIARNVSLVAKVGAVGFVYGLRDQAAINLQLLGGVWILQIFPAVAIGLYTRRLHPRALFTGWAVGMTAGTVMVVQEGFSPVVPFGPTGHVIEVYAGLAALLVNLTVAVALTPVLHRFGVPRGTDTTALPPGLVFRRRPGTGASSTCDG
ncbi:sodium:solute symporter [Streptomyces sp. SID4919]|uniref:sodium:solute symporter family protein n=1 Tax=unclassified Streptomyces TaxID=2593676 RepID=UPI000823BD5E|nr:MULTISPECIES: sodium:solute symporter [unclassified Streptomyces]MYY09742.1 sodium:solute symporter [Streptomyces sp. SID4919]SCK35958.1 solute:Na+ symporter, SSS family [Streptomyces sp. AmelKG-E11A]